MYLYMYVYVYVCCMYLYIGLRKNCVVKMNVCLFVQDCVHGAKCVTFVCPLINMKKSATLTVRARLWNATMIEVQTVMVLGSRLRLSVWLTLSADGG